jgi:hypothetical protein
MQSQGSITSGQGTTDRQRLGLAASADIRAPGLDMAIGLFVAVSIAVIFIEMLAVWLTRVWSFRSLFVSLIIFAAGAVFAALLINAPFHSYWSLFGILFPLTEALLMWRLGLRISTDTRARSKPS